MLPNRLYLLLNNATKNNNNLFKIITSRTITINKNNYLLAASKPPSQQTTTTTTKPNQSIETNELDKPEWERSYRTRVFYGFDFKNEANDTAWAHQIGFISVSIFICFGFFIFFYMPSTKNDDWAYREAQLEIARRKKSGEPLISPDYIPVDKIKLPSEEELKDVEIII